VGILGRQIDVIPARVATPFQVVRRQTAVR
jgi:hypothetical protein